MIASLIIALLLAAIAWTGSPELRYAFWSWLDELLERLEEEEAA